MAKESLFPEYLFNSFLCLKQQYALPPLCVKAFKGFTDFLLKCLAFILCG